MGSMNQTKDGKWRYQFSGNDKKRHTIHLGNLTKNEANRLKGKIESLERSVRFGIMLEDSVIKWLVSIAEENLYKKLVNVSLVQIQIKATVGKFINEYIGFKKQSIKNSTLKTLMQTKERIVVYLGDDKNIADVSRADAEKYISFLRSIKRLADATICRDLKRCREIFEFAKKSRIISENPFSGLRLPSQENKARMFTITLDMARKVLDACPTLEWKLIFAFARYGGVRIPSEITELKWEHILWDQNKIKIQSPKTAHQGKPFRLIPLFPELKALLKQGYEDPSRDIVFIIKNRSNTKNYRKGLHNIIIKAGVEPWPKLFNNLRSSRATELAKNFSIQASTTWMGNTPKVALSHYLQVTDAEWGNASRHSTSDVINDEEPLLSTFE